MSSFLLKKHFSEFFSLLEAAGQYNSLALLEMRKGDYICMCSQSIGHLHFLVQGRAKVIRLLENGNTKLFSIYFPGSLIGDIEYFSHAEKTGDGTETLAELAAFMGVSYSYVTRTIRLLKEEGLIKKEKTGTACVYLCGKTAFHEAELRKISNRAFSFYCPLFRRHTIRVRPESCPRIFQPLERMLWEPLLL